MLETDGKPPHTTANHRLMLASSLRWEDASRADAPFPIDDAQTALRRALRPLRRGPARNVEAAMTHNPVVTSSSTSVRLALSVAARQGFSHLLVAEGAILVGVLCICELWEAPGADLVGHHVKPFVVTIDPRLSVSEAATLMRENDLGCLPVVSGDVTVGVLTRGDLLRRASIDLAVSGLICRACSAHHHVRRLGAVFDEWVFCKDCLETVDIDLGDSE